MNDSTTEALARSLERFTTALEALEEAPAFARPSHVGRVLDTAERLLRQPGGASSVYDLAPRFDAAGLFAGTDWDRPECLQPGLVPPTLTGGERWTVLLECLSLLRLLAIAKGRHSREGLSAEQATHYLRQVLALTLELVFDRQSEAARVGDDRSLAARNVLQFVADLEGDESLLEHLVEETWRLLRQRPIQVDRIRTMVTKLSVYCHAPDREIGEVPRDAERLAGSLYHPSPASREDPGVAAYAERLETMDARDLREEAMAFGRSMHETGLASPYHAMLIRHLLDQTEELIPVALGLSTTGIDGYVTYRQLVHAMIDKAVHHETCQCLYGLALLLERAVLHIPGVAPSLWRQIQLSLTEAARARIVAACGEAHPPDVFLLSGVLSVLGLPLGIGQGDNPTCQSARALSLWAYSDPTYLLQLLAWAARDDAVLMTFHDAQLSSATLAPGAAGKVGIDLDPVSLVLVPHLDRIYAEMTRLAHKDGEDPHRDVNPEFHGWRVGQGFAIAVDVPTGHLQDYEEFVRRFYASYHPTYNGGHPVIHPQPVGVAMTDSLARFVGWHAITLLRVTLDMSGRTRVYFYNPNNDSGQDWGHGVKVSTHGHGEEFGESSLPVAEFVSRLYLFHYDPLEMRDPDTVPAGEVERVTSLGRASWAAGRIPPGPGGA